MKKHYRKVALALLLTFSVTAIPALAVGSNEIEQDNPLPKEVVANFDVREDDTHTTACVLVKDGIAYTLTEEEYLSLLELDEFTDEKIVESADSDDFPTPYFSFYYTFSPNGCTYAYYDSMRRRVSPVYGKADSVSVTNSMMYTRTITESGSVSVTASIKDIIDTSVTSSYSVSVSSASSKTQSVTGTFKPSGKYLYSAVVFTPRLATVTGNLLWWQNFENDHSILSTTPCSIRYPAGSDDILDGLYKLAESNDRNSFPEMA